MPSLPTGPPMDVSTDLPSPGRPLLSVSGAAKACGVSRRTIHRRLAEKAFPAATQDHDGTWRIPVDDLLGAGFHLYAPVPETPIPTQGGTESAHGPAQERTPEVGRLRDALVEAERRLGTAEHRANLAEAIAAERLRTIDTLSTALRALQPGPQPARPTPHDEHRAAPPPGQPPSPEAADPPRPRRWWSRRRRSSPVDLATVGHPQDLDHPGGVVHSVDGPVVPDTQP